MHLYVHVSGIQAHFPLIPVHVLQDQACFHTMSSRGTLMWDALQHTAPTEFSLPELHTSLQTKCIESRQKELEDSLCLRKQKIETGYVPMLKSE